MTEELKHIIQTLKRMETNIEELAYSLAESRKINEELYKRLYDKAYGQK